MAGLRVTIEGLRFRASDGKLGADDQVRIVRRRLSNPAALRLRDGDSPAVLAEVISQRQPPDLTIHTIEAISETAVASKPRVELPVTIHDSRLSFKVARGVIPGSLLNGREIAASINEQNPGRKLRVPIEAELLTLNKLLGSQLEDRDYWIWTETEHQDYPGQFVLRHQAGGNRLYFRPEFNCADSAVRFVEDK
ncbi:hypothetical protein A3H38_03710 [candidate division WOR-1 bacterium RIFCSPLOWO2_02_FULL_46_20]|uniref:Uncharacterized protein n=1 Tax=candidate division WOR-1 bacterium RIFCSPLOWO2_02_FULL_46_20 TaxID=1802567 RepID=A0A1F4R4H0_UNCSA|nr:MAG: hypothetical protein A3J44_03120 [candidate division WOR-1 bacterium RIFCSPHIGHO2_02_FULL_45_12]OGC03131.1 MAG: hypothetical protein A3H38_03710 [candidate division WOR-1 bacterium RIFCSPLOWO2_02_FULL_46_20]